MVKRKPVSDVLRAAIAPGFALLALLVIGGYALLGPTGILAWGEYRQRIEIRQTELASLKAERDSLRNRVNLLDPNNVDPDLASELLRKNLNVAHPDELIVPLR